MAITTGDLNQLVRDALGSTIQTGGLPLEEALYRRQAQSELESGFGKGLGISTVTRDALAKARTDAALAAQSAQLSALGQAAGVAQQELNRGQQAGQFQQSLGLQKKALGQQRDIANQNLLATGLGLGLGGLAQVGGRVFGPEITKGLRGLAGLPSGREPISPLGGRETMLAPGQIPQPETMPSFTAPAMGDLSGLTGLSQTSLPSVDLGSIADWSSAFSLPDLVDLSWLSAPDTTYSLLAL